MSDPQEWYRGIPPVTKVLFTGMLVTTLAGNFGLVNPYNLVLLWEPIWHNFQIWRLATSVMFFPKLSFAFLINLYFLYSYSNKLETESYHRKRADYAYMHVFMWLLVILVGLIMTLWILVKPYVISIVYVWSLLNPDVIVQFWFGTKFPAMYLPWVLTGFNILIGASSGFEELVGIFVGHCYIFLKYKYPEMSGRQFLETPEFFKRWFPEELPGVSGFGQAPTTRQAPPQNRANYFGGAGHRLGGDQ